MKVIGPYVISAAPVGAALHGPPGSASLQAAPESGPSAWNRPEPGSGHTPGRTHTADVALPLHGVDRLTGMPVLLHRLHAFLVPVTLPESPFLLPVSEVDVWDAQPYAVTELPPAAVLADHPGTAAPGVLRALAALHGAGLVHGGLNAGQFWQVGREVRLAGAGLPWRPGAVPADDMKALAVALDTLGARPTALRGLEGMGAAEALVALEEAQATSASPDSAGAESARIRSPKRSPQGTEALRPGTEAAPARPLSAAPLQVRPERRGSTPAPVPAFAQTTPAAATPDPGTAPQLTPEPRRTAPAEPRRRWDDRPDRKVADRRSGDLRRQAAQTTLETDAPEADPLPVLPATAAAPIPQTYRSESDVIVIGDEPGVGGETDPAAAAVSEALTVARETAATQTAATQTPAPEPSPTSSAPSAPAPILIGFDDLPELPADWAPEDADETRPGSSPHPAPAAGTAAGEPALTPDAGTPEAAEEAETAPPKRPAGRTTRYTPTGARPLGGRAPGEAPAFSTAEPETAGGPRRQALRIGWEEDHSWRVVKSGPEPRSSLARRLPRWPLVPLVLAVLAGAAYWWSTQSAAPAAACCSQEFAVLGSNLPVKVTLVQAPPGSPLQPGAVIGTAPGVLKFPDAPGRYTLRFSAEGHGALTGAVSVPSSQAFSILLK